MPRLHHVNITIPAAALAAEEEFLTQVIGLRQVAAPPGSHWFDADGGTQVHVSLDPRHVPSGTAHIAVNVGGQVPAAERTLAGRGIAYKAIDDGGDTARRRLFVTDPGGNLWEIRPGG